MQRRIEVLDLSGAVRPWPSQGRKESPQHDVRYEGVPARGLVLGVVLGAALWLGIVESVLALLR